MKGLDVAIGVVVLAAMIFGMMVGERMDAMRGENRRELVESRFRQTAHPPPLVVLSFSRAVSEWSGAGREGGASLNATGREIPHARGACTFTVVPGTGPRPSPPHYSGLPGGMSHRRNST